MVTARLLADFIVDSLIALLLRMTTDRFVSFRAQQVLALFKCRRLFRGSFNFPHQLKCRSGRHMAKSFSNLDRQIEGIKSYDLCKSCEATCDRCSMHRTTITSCFMGEFSHRSLTTLVRCKNICIWQHSKEINCEVG